MDKNMRPDVYKAGLLALGVLAATGLAGYALAYILVMPKVSPSGFVPTTLGNSAGAQFHFGTLQAVFVLVYAFAFLPVVILFTIKEYHTQPYALIFACCLLGVSLLIEIINNLPVLASGIYPVRLESISPGVRLYLRQVEAIRYLSYDVAGFTTAYAAFFIYALVFLRSHRLLSYTIFGSIVLFIANVPFLWFAPNLAVILMALSIFAFASVPVFMARMAVDGFERADTKSRIRLVESNG